MNQNPWRERILEMLASNPGRKEKYLRSVLAMIDRYGPYFPTEPQKTLLRRFWESHERRKLEEILG